MRDLVEGEVYKMYKSTLCKVLFFIFTVISSVVIFEIFTSTGKYRFENMGEDELLNVISRIIYAIPKNGINMHGVVTFLSLLIVIGIVSSLFIVPVFSSMFISAEFSTRSIQQLVGKGIARHRIVLSRFIAMSLFIIIMNLGIAFIGFIVTSAVYGIGNIAELIVPILVFTAKMVLLNAVFMAISSLVAYCFKSSCASMPISFIVVAYIFSSFGEMVVDGNSILFIIVSLLLIGAFLASTIMLFGKSDIH